MGQNIKFENQLAHPLQLRRGGAIQHRLGLLRQPRAWQASVNQNVPVKLKLMPSKILNHEYQVRSIGFTAGAVKSRTNISKCCI